MNNVEKAKEFGELTMKVSLDVSEALTGLKAVQREAREATKALRKLESYYEQADGRYYAKWTQQGDEISDMKTVKISEVPTEYLRKELAKRGIINQPITVAPLTVDSPFIAPLTISDVPEHVRDYGKSGEVYTTTNSKPRAWFTGGDSE
ncbi:hypothetical protein MHI57_24640 [Cytobacillus sp. FSL K6-0129]|uniref:hypothetical protein n=1 Tax=Cytobacillus sp. FSL K6-0129 TaxID=2921421 RepID=UPI0030FA2C40